MSRAFLVFLLVVVPRAFARNEDGTLDLLAWPHCGAPALVVPGGGFDVRLSEEARLTLVAGEARHVLETEWRAKESGRYLGRCNVPEGLRPGAYGLEVTTSVTKDINPGVVHVLDAFPDAYVIAQVGDLMLREGDKAASDRARAILREARDLGAVFAIVTGKLVADGAPGSYAQAVEVLSRAPLPVYVCPEGASSPTAIPYWGHGGYTFRFGRDGYLAFDASGSPPAADEEPQISWIHRARRSIRDARWSVGFAQRYSHAMGMRAQLVLFVDDPLDALLSSTAPTHEGHPLPMAPWGRTALFPFADQGWRPLHVGSTIEAAPVAASEAPDKE